MRTAAALRELATWMDDHIPTTTDGNVVHTVDATINEQHGGLDFTLLTAAGQRVTGRVNDMYEVVIEQVLS